MNKLGYLIQKLSHDIIDVRIRSSNALLFKLERGIFDDTIMANPLCSIEILNGLDQGLERLLNNQHDRNSNDINALIVAYSNICNLILCKAQNHTKGSCTDSATSILQKFYHFLNDTNIFSSTKIVMEKTIDIICQSNSTGQGLSRQLVQHTLQASRLSTTSALPKNSVLQAISVPYSANLDDESGITMDMLSQGTKFPYFTLTEADDKYFFDLEVGLQLGKDELLQNLQNATRDFPPSVFLQRVNIIDSLLRVSCSVITPGFTDSLSPVTAMQVLVDILYRCYDFILQCESSWAVMPMALTNEASIAARMAHRASILRTPLHKDCDYFPPLSGANILSIEGFAFRCLLSVLRLLISPIATELYHIAIRLIECALPLLYIHDLNDDVYRSRIKHIIAFGEQLAREFDFKAIFNYSSESKSMKSNLTEQLHSIAVARCILDISYYAPVVSARPTSGDIVFSRGLLTLLQEFYAFGIVHACPISYCGRIKSILESNDMKIQENDENNFLRVLHGHAKALCTARNQDIFIQYASRLIVTLTAFPWQTQTVLAGGVLHMIRRIMTVVPTSKKDAAVYHKCEELSLLLLCNIQEENTSEEYTSLCELLCCEQRNLAIQGLSTTRFTGVNLLDLRSHAILSLATQPFASYPLVHGKFEELAAVLLFKLHDDDRVQECVILCKVILSEQSPAVLRIAASKCLSVIAPASAHDWLTHAAAESHLLSMYTSSTEHSILELLEKNAALIRGVPDSMQNSAITKSLIEAYLAAKETSSKNVGGLATTLLWCNRYLHDRHSYIRYLAVKVIKHEVVSECDVACDNNTIIETYELIKNILLDDCECWSVKCISIETILRMLSKYSALAQVRQRGYCLLFSTLAEMFNIAETCDVSMLLRAVRVFNDILQSVDMSSFAKTICDTKLLPLLCKLLKVEVKYCMQCFDGQSRNLLFKQNLPFQSTFHEFQHQVALQYDMLIALVAKVFESMIFATVDFSLFRESITRTNLLASALSLFFHAPACEIVIDVPLRKRYLPALADLITSIFSFDTSDPFVTFCPLLRNPAVIMYSLQDSLAVYLMKIAESLSSSDPREVEVISTTSLCFLRLLSCVLSSNVFLAIDETSDVCFRLTDVLMFLFSMIIRHSADPNLASVISAILLCLSQLFQRYTDLRCSVISRMCDRIYAGVDFELGNDVFLLKRCCIRLNYSVCRSSCADNISWKYSHLLLQSLFLDCNNRLAFEIICVPHLFENISACVNKYDSIVSSIWEKAVMLATFANLSTSTRAKKELLQISSSSESAEYIWPVRLLRSGLVATNNSRPIRMLSLRLSQAYMHDVGHVFVSQRSIAFGLAVNWLNRIDRKSTGTYIPFVVDIMATCAHGSDTYGSMSELLSWLYDNFKQKTIILVSVLRAIGVMASGHGGQRVAASVNVNELLQRLLDSLLLGGELEKTAAVALWGAVNNSERAMSLCKTAWKESNTSFSWLDREEDDDMINLRAKAILKILMRHG